MADDKHTSGYVMSPDRLAYLRGLGDDDLPAFWLVQIRDLLAECDRLAQQHEQLQAKLRAMSECGKPFDGDAWALRWEQLAKARARCAVDAGSTATTT